MDASEEVLTFWFGHVEQTVIPTEDRARIWFSDSKDIDEEISERFRPMYDQLIEGESSEWNQDSRSKLSKIIILDQFSRHIFRGQAESYAYDDRALETCLQGIHQGNDHQLSLIERVFFYFPLMHSEKVVYQEQSVIAYTVLSDLAFDETKIIYESFLKFANHHYTIIQRFGRFPQRNAVLNRTSTPEELQYLENQIENTE